MTELEIYHANIDAKGFEETWKEILKGNFYLNIESFPYFYEEGLAYINKQEKKDLGKYYTPIDVADVMSKYFSELNGEAICDVCCGVGNLILAYLKLFSKEKARELIIKNKVYLYDTDPLAIEICKFYILYYYGKDLEEYIVINTNNFLDDDVHLPLNAKVISNPPYGKLTYSLNTKINKKAKELYSAFLEKILSETKNTVIITPHSFLNGTKFAPLRKFISNYNGKIFNFDNVPGNIFKGKKFGIFNTNNANSVRASISVFDEKSNSLQVSSFIRFSTKEREQVLNKDFLNTTLCNVVDKDTDDIFLMLDNTAPNEWLKTKSTISSLLTGESEFALYVPKTCRYFTVGAKKNLKRDGKYILYAKSENDFYLLYAMINSSYSYYYYRIANGGITYPLTLLKSCPVPTVKDFNSTTFVELKLFVEKMISEENDFITLKKNAGKEQESIKFPVEYREKLNMYLAHLFGTEYRDMSFEKVHANNLFSNSIEVEEEEEEN